MFGLKPEPARIPTGNTVSCEEEEKALVSVTSCVKTSKLNYQNLVITRSSRCYAYKMDICNVLERDPPCSQASLMTLIILAASQII